MSLAERLNGVEPVRFQPFNIPGFRVLNINSKYCFVRSIELQNINGDVENIPLHELDNRLPEYIKDIIVMTIMMN